MNILLIMGAQGGVGRHIVDLSYGLRKLGHDITIIHNKIVDQALKQDFQELKKFGVKSSEINFGRNISINDFITLFRILFFIIFSKKFDVIHGHSSKGGVYARIVGFFSRASIVYTPHAFYTMNTSLGTIKFNLIKYIEAFLSLFSDRIILTSKSEWDHAEALKINKSKLVLIPNGAYMSPFSKIKYPRKKKSTKSVGFVGRLCFQKDPLRAVKIFSLALNMNKQLKLSILGDGEYLKSLRDLINKTDLSLKIKIIKEKNLKDFLKDIDLLLVTSRYEGSPYLFQDACMASIPIISTDVGGVEFFVKKGINGYVYSTNDEASRMINKCLKSKNFMNQISERSVKISSRYSLENMVSQTLELYLSI